MTNKEMYKAIRAALKKASYRKIKLIYFFLVGFGLIENEEK